MANAASQHLPFYTYDAFASSKRFSGNPAAVLLLPDESIPTDLLQLIATEINLSETAFVTRLSGDNSAYVAIASLPFQTRDTRQLFPSALVYYRTRALCGHATLAAAKCLFLHDPTLVNEPTLRFVTQTGDLYASKLEDDQFQVDFPADLPVAVTDPTAKDHARAVFREAIPTLSTLTFEIYKHKRGYMAFVRLPPSTTLGSLTVKSDAFLQLDGMVHFITCDQHAKEPLFCDFTSRSFAPAIGIKEDMVTGTAHTSIAPFFVHHRSGVHEPGPVSLTGFQASQRTGVVKCIVDGDRVMLRGKIVSVLSGTMQLPD